MTRSKPPLSVRLDTELAQALERHCARTGKTRSAVVQQSVAQYLAVEAGPTLGSLAEAVLPPPGTGAVRGRRVPRASRQERFRDYVREKRRR